MTEPDPTTTPEDEQDPQAPGEEPGQEPATEEPETFPREYVEKLRRESAGYRERAQRADDLARALWTARVAATGRLADPEDLDYDEDALDDPDALTAAIDDLLTRRPHYAARRPTGDVGQGATGGTSGPADLAALLRGNA